MQMLHSSNVKVNIVQPQHTLHIHFQRHTKDAARTLKQRKSKTMAFTQSTQYQAPTVAWISNALHTLADRLERRAVYRTTLNELSNLNGRELADLGMSRGSLRAVAYEAAYGK
jgi:uncharacterized protein YjiS (DUF1127 family)